MATPGTRPEPANSNQERRAYDASAPRGVERLNAAMCFLQSVRERGVERSEVVSARAVGAVPPPRPKTNFEMEMSKFQGERVIVGVQRQRVARDEME